MEEPIDKRSGRSYGPPSLKKLIYFIDDLNMPFKEEYGTQTPIALLRQYHDYQTWDEDYQEKTCKCSELGLCIMLEHAERGSLETVTKALSNDSTAKLRRINLL